VSGLEGALPLVPHSVDLDCRGVGVPGEVYADIVHDKRSVHCRVEKVNSSGLLYRIHFTPKDVGKHRVRQSVFVSQNSSNLLLVGLRVLQWIRRERVAVHDARGYAKTVQIIKQSQSKLDVQTKPN
jgi:hypothetical protein